MDFHTPCGVVLYNFVYKFYANKEKNDIVTYCPYLIQDVNQQHSAAG